MVESFRIHRKTHSLFMSDNQIILFLINRIEVKSYNRRERKDTYNVIGIMKGEIEPGTIS